MKYQRVKENLIRYHDAIKPTSDINEYIKRVSDYVDYIVSVGYLQSELKKLQIQSRNSFKVFSDKEDKLLIELEKFIEQLKKLLQDHNIQEPKVDTIFREEIEPILTNRVYSSLTKANNLLINVYDLFNTLRDLNNDGIVKELGYIKNNRWNLTIDSFIQEYESEKERHKEDREKELWGSWDYISIVPKANSFIYTKDFKGFGEGIDLKDEFIKEFYVSLFHTIRSKETHKQEKIKTTIKEKLERVHIFLLRKVDEAADAKIWTKRGIANVFNADVSVLVVHAVEVVIAAFIGYLIGKL